MKKAIAGILSIALLVLVSGSCSQQPVSNAPSAGPGAAKAEAADTTVKPFAKNGGKPFRIAVVQSGDYFAYNDVLESIYNGLADLGWTDAVPLTEAMKASIPQMLDTWSTHSKFLSFAAADYVDLNWTEDANPPVALRELLGGGRGVDLVISLGTLAGTFAAKISREGGLKVPVMVESVSDPLGSKIVDSLTDSGHELISSSSDPEIYDRQIRLFHKVIGFKRLGLIYTDTETGRAYAALPVVTKAASDLGFAIVADTDVLEDPPDPKDIPKAEAAFVAAMERLGPKVDAVYLAIQAGLTDASLPAILAVAEKYKLPTFIMEGRNYVWKGTLLGESASLLAIEGLYTARKLTRILKGDSLRTLPQANPHMPHIAVNLATAKKLGFDIPVDILLSADDVYTDTMPSATEVTP